MEHLKGSVLTHKRWKSLLGINTNLSQKFVNYGRQNFYKIDPRPGIRRRVPLVFGLSDPAGQDSEGGFGLRPVGAVVDLGDSRLAPALA